MRKELTPEEEFNFMMDELFLLEDFDDDMSDEEFEEFSEELSDMIEQDTKRLDKQRRSDREVIKNNGKK